MDKKNEVLILNIDDVLPNRFQPRIKFNEKNILELADSIREHGVIQPIVVRKISDKYEIIAGERRYKASILAGKTTIPAIVTNFDDKQSAEVALLENVQRQDLTPIEEAISYKKILDMGYINQTDLAEKLGKTQSTIANKLRLLNLTDEVQEALLEGKISERHARSLLKLKNKKQVELLNRIISERMTVRKTDDEINKILSETAEEDIIIENENNNEVKEISKNTDFEIVDFESEEDLIKENTSLNLNNIKEENKEGEGEKEMNQSNNIFNPFMAQNNNVNENPQPTFDNETNQNNFFNINQNNDANVSNPIDKPLDNFKANQNVTENPFMNNVQPVQLNNDEPDSQTGGRFFNIFENNNTNNSISNNNYVEDLESKEVNMNLGQPNENNNSNFNFNAVDTSIFSNPVENNNVVPDNPFISNVQPTQTEPVQSQVNVNPFVNMGQTTAFNMPQQNNNIPPVQEFVQNPTNNTNEQVVTNQNIFGPTQNFNSGNKVVPNNELSFNNSNINPNVQENSNILNSVQSTNNIVPEQDLFNSQLKPYSLDDEEEFVNQSAVEMASTNPFARNEYETNQEPPVVMMNKQEIPVSPKTDLRTVINTIRNCAETIENYGYNIETEEADFEDSYQVLFKIEK